MSLRKPLFIVLFLLLIAAAFLAGIWYSPHGTGRNPVNKERLASSAPLAEEGDSTSIPPGAVKITPQRQQMTGVRIEKVEKESRKHALRTLGRVSANENLTYRIVASTDGWVSNVREGTTGSLVKKNQLLATVYNYQFLTREQQYLYALDFEDRRQKSRAQATSPRTSAAPSPGGREPKAGSYGAQETMPSPTMEMTPVTPGGEMNPTGRAVYSIRDQLEVAKLELYSLGVGDYQVQELTRTRKLASDIEIRSPADGIVLSRNVSPEQRFDKGIELFRIADLKHVWIVADIFGQEARYVRPGMKARVFLPGYDKVFTATVSDIPPQVDPVTRTWKVRLETDNPRYALRPDMFVDVEFDIGLPPAVTISVDALLDSGYKKTVFVDLGNGIFEPREVQTGWQFGNRVEITKGLNVGERIAASGAFLIDSESRLAQAAAGMVGMLVTDPVCGVDVSMARAEKSGRKSSYGGETYYFTSDECKTKFDEKPDRYVRAPPGESSAPERTDASPSSTAKSGEKGQ